MSAVNPGTLVRLLHDHGHMMYESWQYDAQILGHTDPKELCIVLYSPPDAVEKRGGIKVLTSKGVVGWVAAIMVESV